MQEMRIVVLDTSQRCKHFQFAVYLDIALEFIYLERA
jgi:hypothetical protein